MRRLVFAVDFDGTCVTAEFPSVGNNIGAAPVLRLLINKGHRIILNTMRSDGGGRFPNTINPAYDWLNKNGIELYGVNEHPEQKYWTKSLKCDCDYCIDDHNIGCPMFYPTSSDGIIKYHRFVNWLGVATWLLNQDIISKEEYRIVYMEIGAELEALERNFDVCLN